MKNILRGNPDCRYCDGTGVRYAPNGPEDFSKEVCECVDFGPASIDQLLQFLGGVTGLRLV